MYIHITNLARNHAKLSYILIFTNLQWTLYIQHIMYMICIYILTCLPLKAFIYIYIYIYTHTHTHIYTYMMGYLIPGMKVTGMKTKRIKRKLFCIYFK